MSTLENAQNWLVEMGARPGVPGRPVQAKPPTPPMKPATPAAKPAQAGMRPAMQPSTTSEEPVLRRAQQFLYELSQ